MTSPKVTIITPTYNCESVIEEAIKSVINQSFTNFEYIIKDGLSSDNTLNIIEKYTTKYNILLISDKDLGVYDAMNKAIGLASGEWIYFLGSDDKICVNALQELFVNNLEYYDFVYGDVIKIPSNFRYDGEFNLAKLFYKNICHQSILVRKELFNFLGLFNTNYKTRADYAFNIQAFSRNCKIRYFPIVIAEFSENGLSSNYFDYAFWNDFRKNIIQPFKGVIPIKERYLSLWNYYCWLVKEKKDFIKSLKVLFLVSLLGCSLKKFIRGLILFVSNLL